MSVAELQGDGIVADAAQSGDDDPGKASWPVASPTLPEDVDLTHVLGARRKLTEEFGAEALLTAVFPGDGDEITDNLKVSRRPHGHQPVTCREGGKQGAGGGTTLTPPAGLGSLDGLMAGVGKLLKQAQKMQRGIAEAQQQLTTEKLEVSHGGGAIKITVNGHGLVLALTIDPEFIKEDKTMVEQALVAALQEASAKARELHEATMSKATAGFSLPGM